MPLAKAEQIKRTHHVAVATKTSSSLSTGLTISQLHDPSLNVGVGAGALYMLITCHEEMGKLKKTLEETETLVQELRQQLHYHHVGSENHQACSVNDRSSPFQNSQADMNHTGPPYACLRTCGMNEVLEEQVPATRGRAKDQMAALAAELEAELEIMELNMKVEDTHPSGTLIHDGGEVSSKGFSNSYYSDTSSHGMVDADVGRSSTHLEACQIDYGVSAIELDYRLRELLEAQQQERILELEQLLKETKAKLVAKEHEILSWKCHVSSLTSLLQPSMTSGTHFLKVNKPSGAESVTVYDNIVTAVPEITKSTVELLHSFQDPPISTQVDYVESSCSTGSSADVSKEETKPQSSSVQGQWKGKRSVNKASSSASLFISGLKDSAHMAGETETHCYQGAGIDMSEYVVMKELDNADRADTVPSRSGLEISKLYCSAHKPDSFGGYVRNEDGTPTGRTGLEVSESHHMKYRFDMEETSASLNALHTEKLDKELDDVKHMVNFVDPKGAKDCEGPEEALQAPKSNNKCLHPTKGLKVTYGRPMKVTSPVLDKIRLFEALGGHAREKRI